MGRRWRGRIHLGKFGRKIWTGGFHCHFVITIPLSKWPTHEAGSRILVNAVGPRAPQGFAEVSAEHFSVNSRQVEIGSIVCAIVARPRERRTGTAIPCAPVNVRSAAYIRLEDSIKAGIVF